ncbi:DUF397 domain-containing protein [Streptomyces sp. NPDC048637]|uniref:DUF397 domain-containing protein n=1 Tax=Streptomyces sp. NPDC048637 TaxID=3155636 RepID=UPI00343C8E01
MTEHTIPNAATLTGWRKSSYSDNEGASCIEVLDGHPSAVPVRDSKTPHGPALLVGIPAWSFFVDALKDGEFPGSG